MKNNVKSWLALILALVMSLSLFACGQKQDDKQPDPALFQQKYRGKQRCREETRKQQPHRVDRDGKRRDYAEAQPDR